MRHILCHIAYEIIVKRRHKKQTLKTVTTTSLTRQQLDGSDITKHTSI